MDFFIIDTVGDPKNNSRTKAPKVNVPAPYVKVFDGIQPVPVKKNAVVEESDDDDEDDYAGLPPPGQNIADILRDDATGGLSRQSEVCAFGTHIWGKWAASEDKTGSHEGARKHHATRLQKTVANGLCWTDVDAHMKTAVMTPSIEKKESIAHLAMSDKARQKLGRAEREKTKGKNWFDMAAPEVTPEVKNELDLLRMRSVLDPKKAFGRVEKRKTPKYFEVGTVLESPLDHFSERSVKKAKKQTLVDELLADAEFQKYNKRKYAEALERKKKRAYHKAVVKMKKEKKKKK